VEPARTKVRENSSGALWYGRCSAAARMRALMAVITLVPMLAWAGDPEIPTASNSTPYWNTCTNVWKRAPYIHVDHPLYLPSGSVSVPAPSASSPGSAPTSLGSIGSGGGKPEALLVLAVVALAVLPFIVYAIDSEADELTLDRFHCPEFSFTAVGGVQVPTGAGQPVVGLGIAKVRADLAYLGGMAEIGLMPAGNSLASAFSAHLLVRPPPKAHIEGALALGGRRAIGPGGALDGFEVALPHMYVFSRDGYKKMGLEVMPRVFFNRRAIDVGADLSFVAPIFDVVQVRAGIGAFSHGGKTQFTAAAGLTAHL
jgi:hypothetical protein